MDDRDPFGRSASDDPLGDMGWTSDAAARPHEGPADVAPPERADHAARREERREAADARAGRRAPSPVPGPRRSRGGLGCAFVVVVLAFLASTAAVLIPAALDGLDVAETVDDVLPTIPEPPAPAPGGGSGSGSKPSRPPTGLEQASLLRRDNLAPALRRLQRVTRSSRVRLLRIDAERVLVQSATAGGGTRLAQATWDGEASVISTSPGGAGGTVFPWSRVDAAAPARIVRAATRGGGTASFDYLVLLDANGLRWSAFLKNAGGTFQAAPDGSGVNRLGGG